MFDAGDAAGARCAPPGDRYAPRSRLVSVEQTTNIAGGRVWPLEQMREVLDVARGAGLRAHLDGARLMNAVVASGVPRRRLGAAGFDTAWLDFTKGLGAPVGAVLAGVAGADRRGVALQADAGAARCARRGSSPPPALYALDHHVERLAEDHAQRAGAGRGAGRAATAWRSTRRWWRRTSSSSTSRDAPSSAPALEAAGVKMLALDDRRVRAVTHLDVDRAGIDRALATARSVLGSSGPVLSLCGSAKNCSQEGPDARSR